MSARAYDAIVLGAGIVGTSIAYHCARAGLSVLLLDRGEPLGNTSGATFAWLGSHLKLPADYNRFTREAIALYAGMEAELDAELEYSRLGSVTLLRTPAEMEQVGGTVRELQADGAPLELWTPAQVRAREPVIGEGFAGGVYCPVDIEINPFKTAAAYLRRAREHGAHVRYRSEVTALSTAGGAVDGVVAGGESYRGRCVVSATGIDSPRIGAMAGVAVPVEQSRGQILVSEKTAPRLGGFVGCRGAGGFMLRQVRAGNFLLGYTSEPVQDDHAVTLEGITGIAHTIAREVPALRDLSLLRAYAGIRPLPRDGLPILGEAPGRRGLLFAVMHSGYTLSAMVGRCVAARITGGDDRGAFRTYGLERFADMGERPAEGGAFGGGD